jgi:pSer/pThr/pTyr-binding forkhead associated (FHA) protein
MWKLTIEDDEGQRTSLDLNQREYTIGRGEDTDIRLTERNISRTHCILRESGEHWEIVDEGSYNGTYVNGERVTAEGMVLNSGDVVNIGDYRIELVDAAEQILDEAEPRQRRPDRLVMVIGPSPGMEYALNGDHLAIGRAEEAFVSINHASVSRLHAELHNLGHSRWEVVDQGSSNGIRINGVELRRGIIEPGDALELGDVRLRFVAAGKFFRPAVDLSQQLPAMPFEGMTATAAASQGAQRSMGLIVAALAIVAGLAVAGYAMFAGKVGKTNSPATSVQPLDGEAAKAILEQAKRSAAAGDLQLAHKELERIPYESPVRELAELRTIEDQWADEMFARAEQSQDPEEKVGILTLISDAVSVSTEKRKEAARRLLAVEPIDDLDRPRPAPVVNPSLPPPTGGEPDSPYPTPAPDPSPSSTKPDPAPPSPDDDLTNNKRNRDRLYAKMQSGRASKTELMQLRALCSLLQDRACRSQADSALSALDK